MSHPLTKRGFYHDTVSQNPKFSHKDWSYNNQLKSRISCDQQKLADRVICEASRVIDETKETTNKFKKETDYRLEERVAHIAFTVEELREQKKFGEREQEILKVLCHPFFLLEYFMSFISTCDALLFLIYRFLWLISFSGHKKSHSVCHRIHKKWRFGHLREVYHTARESDGNRFVKLPFVTASRPPMRLLNQFRR